MSPKKPGAGVRISGGRLRVDAARAIDKLRSYQLADPTGWVLEVVRAGVGLSALAISIEGSGSDVFVAIACEPPPDASLPRLFEELVDPSPDPAARPLRLLAIGLNAALGGATRFADVYVVDGGGSRRVRFTPEVFATEGKDQHDVAPGMRKLRVEPEEAPSFAPRPARGLLVHVRSKVALALLARWATGQLPPELALVNDAATEVAIPISVNGLPVPRDPTILLREPLDEGGYVAILTPRGASTQATLEAAELGVVLSREPWAVDLSDDDAPIPLVCRIDRARLPTNAARSAVRWDEPILEQALAEAKEALGRLVKKLAKAIDDETDPARRSWLRLAGITLLAADVRGPSYREKLIARNVRAPLWPLLDAALLVDATGRRRSVSALRNAVSTSQIHYAPVFARAALAPWVGDVLAAPPGDPMHLFFDGLPPPSAEDMLARAEGALQIRERWLSQLPGPPIVPSRAGAILRVPLDGAIAPPITPTATVAVGGHKRRKQPAATVAPEGLTGFPGLLGEVVFGAGDGGLLIDLRFDGRTLERVRKVASIPIWAMAEHSSFVPALSYEAVTDGITRREVLLAIDRAVLHGCEAIARALASDPAPDWDRTEWLIDHALARLDARATTIARDGLVVLVHVSDGASDLARRLAASPLTRAPAWQRIDGSAISLAELQAESVIGLIPEGRTRNAVLPNGRIVIRAGDAERLALMQALPGVRVVDYGRDGTSRLSAASIARDLLGACAIGVAFDHGDCRGFAGWGVDRTEVSLSHVGVPLGRRDSGDGMVPTRVRVDDDRIIPNEGWSRFEIDRKGAGEIYSASRLSTEIARQVVRAWLGERPETLLGRADLEGDAIVRAVLLEARNGLVEASEAAKLRGMPLFPVFGREDRATLDEIVGHGAAIPFVPTRAFPPEEKREVEIFALELERAEAEGIAALFGLRASMVDSTSLIRAALKKQIRDDRIARIRRGAQVAVALPGAHPTVPLSGTGIVEGLLGYAPHAREGRIRVLVERRPFAVLTGSDAGLPSHVEGIVSLDESLIDDRVEALSEAGRSRVRGAALSAARALLPKLLSARGTSLFADTTVVALASDLVDRKKRKGEPGALIDALCALPSLPSVAGNAVSIDGAMASGDLFFSTELVDWVGPLEGEPRDDLDRPIAHVQYPADHPARALLERLTDGAMRDVTIPLRRLVTVRRAARGLTPRPPLPPSMNLSLSRTVEELAAKSAKREMILETLGIGAIGLAPERPSRVAFYEAGGRIHEESLDFVPPFEAAVESPLVGRTTGALGPDTRDRIRQAIAAVLADLLRALADDRAFEGAPGWAIDAQRDAAILGGKEHLDQLAEVPLFETTAGTRASPSALSAQAQRFGAVWWTRDLESELQPLEPERIVLRASLAMANGLGSYVRLFDAQDELQRDQVARQNRDRRPVESIAPHGRELESPFGAVSYVEAEREVAAIPLLPIRAAEAGMYLHRERRLLERRDVPGAIPAIVRVDSPSLVPNRMWDGVIRDAELERIESIVELAVERAVREKLPRGGSSATELAVDATLMGSVPHSSGRVVRGTLWLGSLDPSRVSGVAVIDMDTESLDDAEVEPLLATAPRRTPAVIPLEGTLVLWGALRETGANTLDAVGRHVYQRLLARIAKRIAGRSSPDADLDLAHLIRGAALGFLSKSATKEAMSVLVPFGVTDIGTVGDVVELFEDDGTVIAIQPEERTRATEQRATLGRPVFVLDGSLAAMHLQLALGDRARTMSEELAEILAIDEVETDDAPAESVPTRAAMPEAQPEPRSEARPRREKKKKKEKARPVEASPTPEPEPERARAPAPVRARAGPIAPLAVALAATFKRLGDSHQTVVDPNRDTPMIVLAEGTVSLAGGDPSLRAIAGTAAGRDRASLLIAAHAFSLGPDAHAALRSLHDLLA